MSLIRYDAIANFSNSNLLNFNLSSASMAVSLSDRTDLEREQTIEDMPDPPCNADQKQPTAVGKAGVGEKRKPPSDVTLGDHEYTGPMKTFDKFAEFGKNDDISHDNEDEVAVYISFKAAECDLELY